MATPRKKWFKVADSILREGWDDRTLARVVRLLAFLNGRWARDGLTAEEACEAWLSPQDCCLIANTSTTRRGREAVVSMPARGHLTDMSVTEERRGGVIGVRLKWPKFSEFQDFASRSPGSHSPGVSLSETQTQDADADAIEREIAPDGALRALEVLSALLEKEPGGSEEKRAWLHSELPIIELRALEDHPDDPARREAAERSRVLRHYRQHLRSSGKPATHHEAQTMQVAKQPSRWEQIQGVYQKGLLPTPDEKSWAAWEQAGRPEAPAWWDPDGPYRPRLPAPRGAS